MPVLSPLLLVDGHNLLHRAAFGFPARITSRHGRDITCAFGFFALLRAAARSVRQPPHVIVVFDGENGADDRFPSISTRGPHCTPIAMATSLPLPASSDWENLVPRWKMCRPLPNGRSPGDSCRRERHLPRARW